MILVTRSFSSTMCHDYHLPLLVPSSRPSNELEVVVEGEDKILES